MAMVRLQNLSQEDQYYLARVSDAFAASDTKNCTRFLGFLDERQQALAQQFAKLHGYKNYLFYGGYDEATRKMMGFFPDYVDLNQKAERLFASIDVLTARFRKEDALAHRDFLGALMSLKITRDSVGDILVADGIGVLFINRTISPIITQELHKVGRIGVRWEHGCPNPLPIEKHFLEIKDTVPSLRLDSVVSSMIRQSREKAAALIKQGLVTQNYECVQNGAHPVQQGDKIAVRGHGKFLLEQADGLTRKGRIPIVCKKYL